MLKDMFYISKGTRKLFSILTDKDTSEKERMALSLLFAFPRKWV